MVPGVLVIIMGVHDYWEHTKALGRGLLFPGVALDSLHIEAHTLMFEYGAAHTIQWKHDEIRPVLKACL